MAMCPILLVNIATSGKIAIGASPIFFVWVFIASLLPYFYQWNFDEWMVKHTQTMNGSHKQEKLIFNGIATRDLFIKLKIQFRAWRFFSCRTDSLMKRHICWRASIEFELNTLATCFSLFLFRDLSRFDGSFQNVFFCVFGVLSDKIDASKCGDVIEMKKSYITMNF